MPLTAIEGLTRQTNGLIDIVRPYMAPLTGAEKEGLRTMGEGREGLVRLISRIASQHERNLAREDNPEDLAGKLDTDAMLEGLRQAGLELLEMVTDIQLSNSADIMLLTDAYTESLQAARRRHTAVDSAMSEVDEWNKRFANKNPNPPAV